MVAVSKERAFHPSHGEKAFLYQQAAELNAPVVVLTGTSSREGKRTYSVTFVVDPARINMKIKERGDTLFEACMKTKITAKKRLFQLVNKNARDNEREALLELIKHSALIQ